jgi:putative ABC transport system substrate-binding protein
MVGKTIIVVWLLALGFGSFRLAGAQQQTKVPRIGILVSAGDPGQSQIAEAFRKGLREVGYIEGKNILIEYRYGQGKLDRIPSLITELVQAKVDVLVVSSLVGIRAAKQTTKSIPIVMLASSDPVATGIVESLARPGGNITGLALLSRELSAKRVELLKEVFPRILRVAILWDADAPGPALAFKEYEAAAQAFKLRVLSLEVRAPNPDFEGAFQAATKSRAGALIVISNPLIIRTRRQIAGLAAKSRLALIYESSRYMEDGGLMSYSARDLDQWSRAATYVDKILKGAKPADLPVEQPTKFELVINLKTAKQIGLTIPPNVLARADKIIK